MAVISASIFASCSKDSDVATGSLPTPDSVETSGGSVISLTLTNDSASQSVATRATTTAETWESSLSSLTIFAFGNDNSLLVKRSLNESERSLKTVSFVLPKSAANTTCTFYAVANIDASEITTKSDLLSMLESSPSSYNGAYSDVTNGALRDGGFVMSGGTSVTVGAANTATPVAITIRRTVAKVALAFATSDSFANSYPAATLSFNSATISKAVSQTYVFDPNSFELFSQEYTHTQSVSDVSKALFYIYECGGSTNGESVAISINATFDADGDSETTDDQSEVVYSFEIEGDGAGMIYRNSLYNINATINGLVGQDCNVTISIAEWETPATQDVNLGM